MWWVFLAVAFMADGSSHAVAYPQPFPTEQDCKTYGTQLIQFAETRSKQDGVEAIVWGCQPVSNPVTERKASD